VKCENCGRLRLECDDTSVETRFHLSAKQMSPFKSGGGVSSVDYWQASCAHQPAGFALLVQACFLQSCDAEGGFTHSMPCPCRAHAVPLPCSALIHTCHDVPLPCFNSVVSFVKFRVVAGNIRTASLTDCPFCSVLLPLFTVVGMDRCKEEWYASDNNLRGSPRGSRKKPNAGR
jgi:hypothetical protein